MNAVLREALPKIRVKFRVTVIRDKPPEGLDEQQTFFVVDRATLLRYVPLLLWDTTVTSLYVDDVDQEVLKELVRL
jgi:hypothetical protein